MALFLLQCASFTALCDIHGSSPGPIGRRVVLSLDEGCRFLPRGEMLPTFVTSQQPFIQLLSCLTLLLSKVVAFKKKRTILKQLSSESSAHREIRFVTNILAKFSSFFNIRDHECSLLELAPSAHEIKMRKPSSGGLLSQICLLIRLELFT